MTTDKYNFKNILFGPGATSDNGYGGIELFQLNLTLNEWIVYIQRNADIKYSDIELISIDGTPGIKATSMGLASGKGKSVLTKKGNYIYNIHLHNIPNLTEKEYLEIFSQILSSFKFTEK